MVGMIRKTGSGTLPFMNNFQPVPFLFWCLHLLGASPHPHPHSHPPSLHLTHALLGSPCLSPALPSILLPFMCPFLSNVCLCCLSWKLPLGCIITLRQLPPRNNLSLPQAILNSYPLKLQFAVVSVGQAN